MKKFFSIILPLALLLSACGDPDKTENNGGSQNSNQNSTNTNGPANNNRNPSNTAPGTPATKGVHKGGEFWPCSAGFLPCAEGLTCVSDSRDGGGKNSLGFCQKVEPCNTLADCASSELGKECLHILVIPQGEGAANKFPERKRTCGSCSSSSYCEDPLKTTCVLDPGSHQGTCQPICHGDSDCTQPNTVCRNRDEIVNSSLNVCVPSTGRGAWEECDVEDADPNRQCWEGYVCSPSKKREKQGICVPKCSESEMELFRCGRGECIKAEVAVKGGDNVEENICWPFGIISKRHYTEKEAPLGEACSLELPCSQSEGIVKCVGPDSSLFPKEGVCKLSCIDNSDCGADEFCDLMGAVSKFYIIPPLRSKQALAFCKKK